MLNTWATYMTAIGHSPSTIRLHSQTVRAAANGNDPAQMSRQDAIRYLARPMSCWSKLTYWKVLRNWSRYLIEFGYRNDDFLQGIPRPRKPEPVARPVTDDTVEQLLAAPLPPRAATYVRLALFQGLRVHEIAKIRGDDFDLNAGWLLVTGKGGRTSHIPIHSEIAKLAEQMPLVGFWFPSVIPGQPVNPKAVTATIGAALRSVGSTATAHQLRDTCATRIQRQVRDIRVTQQLLRHRSIKSTQKYTQVADADMQAAMLALNWAAPT
jgi:integrase/recombinase XerD